LTLSAQNTTGPSPSEGPSIVLVYFNAGGGHRAAALALETMLRRQYPRWNVLAVDLFQVIDSEQRFRRLTGFAPEAYYNKRLATGFTIGLSQELKILQAMIRVANDFLVDRLELFWRQLRPSMVVSLVPNFNRALGQSLRQFNAQAPFVTVMTDLADYPPHFWIEPGYTQHLVCPTHHAVEQARLQGIALSCIHLTSGVILSPRFYESTSENRALSRQALGIAPTATLGVVMFGGQGSSSMIRIAIELADTPLVLMCGRNEALRRKIDALPRRAPRHTVGFTDDVPKWMHLADFFIGKPGPGSISEALHCGLPVIVARNAWTMPQERWNTDWIKATDVGVVLPSLSKIRAGVDKVITSLDRLRSNAGRLNNRAIFEVPEILQSIFVSRYVT
jgi:hypothetical protein